MMEGKRVLFVAYCVFSCKGIKYFECPNKYGMFIRPKKIAVGDYPEKDIFDEDSDSEIDEI